MSLKLHLAELSQDQRSKLAQGCDTTVGHLRNVSYGLREASPALAMQLERKTKGAVTRRDLRPNDYHLIWPELAPAKKGRANA